MSRNITEVDICIQFPPKVTSPGYLGIDEHKHHLIREPLRLFEYSGTRLMLQIFIILAVSRLCHRLLKRIGLPIFFSQIIAGMVVGQTLMKPESTTYLSPQAAEDNVKVMGTISTLGYFFYLFMTGVKVDPGITRRTRFSFYIGIVIVVVPVASVLLITCLAGLNHGNIFSNKSLYMAVTYSLSSFPVTHSLLSELKIVNTELGRLGLASTIVSDVFSLFIIILVTMVDHARTMGTHQIEFVVSSIGKNIVFVLLICVSRVLIKWSVRRFAPGGARVKDGLVYTIIALFLLSPDVARSFAMFLPAGPYLFGLAVLEGPPLGTALVEKFDFSVSEFLLPLFTATCASRVDFSSLGKFDDKFMVLAASGTGGTFLVKFLVSMGSAMFCNLPLKDSLALAFILCTKGVVELGMYSFMNEFGIIPDNVFALSVMTVILITTISPLMARYFYDPSRKHSGYQNRNIMHSSLHNDLRMLACIHAPAHVTSMLNLLDLSCPTEESPVAIDVLHLVKLRGEATPLFVSHNQHENVFSANSYSGNVVLAFNQFERDHHKTANVAVFTAVSPAKLMHEDIFNLALDHRTSFIIIPFHRRWLADGTVESDDSTIRSVNSHVLDRSPCSVGILVQGRRNFKRSTSQGSIMGKDGSIFKVAMIFLGGDDDREALTLANWYALDTKVGLTVIHLQSTNQCDETRMQSYQRIIDEELLRDVKSKEYVRYVEKKVNDGPETSVYLREMVNEFDLIIVGRRYESNDPQTAGLQASWSEFPELGIIGDLLASENFNCGHSILIVQQQQTTTKTYAYLFSG